MNRAEKVEMVNEIKAAISPESAILIAHYSALSHKEMESMRKDLRGSDCNMRVVRNSLMKVFAESRDCKELTQGVKGQSVMIWGKDLLKLIKVAHSSEKKFEDFNLIAAFADSQVIGKDYIKSLADLPSSEYLYSKLIGVINSSALNLSRVLNLNTRRLLLALGKRND